MLHAKKIPRNNFVTIVFLFIAATNSSWHQLGFGFRSGTLFFYVCIDRNFIKFMEDKFHQKWRCFRCCFSQTFGIFRRIEELKKENTIPNLEMFSIPGFVFLFISFFYCLQIFINFFFHIAIQHILLTAFQPIITSL